MKRFTNIGSCLAIVVLMKATVVAQCPSTGCTITINGPDPTNYTVNSGQKLCLAAAADYTGTITMNGGVLDNCATNPQTLNILFNADDNSVVNNYGSMIFANLDIDYGTFNNHGTITETNGLDVRNTAQLNNYDSIWVGNAFTTRDSAKLNNFGQMVVIGNFDELNTSYIENYGSINGSSRFKIDYDFYNQGSITINGLWDNGTASRTFTNNGGCITVTNWDNDKITVGLTCGTITITGNSDNKASGVITGNIAVVDLTPPGGPPYVDNNSGTIDPSVQWTSCGCPGAVGTPVAFNDVVLVYHDATTPINVISNDWNTDTVFITIIDSLSNGILGVQPNGSVHLTPAIGFVGADTFLYQICDTATPQNCDTASVFVTVVCSTFDPDTISGYVFHDHLNADGTFDGSETGTSGIKLWLYDDVNQNNTVDGGDVLLDSTNTLAGGAYTFLINIPKDSLPVLSNSDDAEQEVISGNTFTWSNDLDFGYLNQGPPSAPYIVGMRFQNINIPAAAVITKAYIEFTSSSDQSGMLDLDIWGELVANPATFSDGSGTYDISGRSPTVNSIAWDNVPAWQTDSLYQTPDLATIIQEIIDVPGWTMGNAMNFIVEGGLGKRESYAHDLNPAEAPRLFVEYAIIAETDYYVVVVDSSTLPAGRTLTTTLELSAVQYTCGGEHAPGLDFGYILPEICNNSTDEDGDGLVDCSDTLDCRPATPGPITASNATVCEFDIGETYSISPVAGAVSYTWTVPAGATVTSGQGSTGITADWGNATGDVCVTASNGSCSSLSSCREIVVRNIPLNPSVINH